MATNKNNMSVKRIAIDKANASLITVITISVFIVIFSIVACKTLYSQMRYQSKVIATKQATKAQIESNIKEVEQLSIAYKEFSSQITNAIGGNPSGTSDRDGDNAKIILDALPSKYDYPALVTSLNKLAEIGGFGLKNIKGTDDEINQSANSSAVNPSPVDMPFTVDATVNNTDGEKFTELFERSIRPILINKLLIRAKDNSLDISITAKTYFQPEKKLNVTEETVK